MNKKITLLASIGLLVAITYFLLAPVAVAESSIVGEQGFVCEDVYSITLNVQMPQVFDNATSLGYRNYQAQNITGTMYVVWLEDGSYRIEFAALENQKFKIRGTKVTYQGYEERTLVYTHYNYIGNNKTGKFTKPTLCFYLLLQPSYAISEMTEDNSISLLVSGSGSSLIDKNTHARIAKKFKGNIAGSQGCSCYDYGHTTPTRKASLCGPSDELDDVVAAYGTWSAVWERRCYCK